jgi:hypothetical protein
LIFCLGLAATYIEDTQTGRQQESPIMRTTKQRRRASADKLAHVDRLLDEALRETFPASDPVAISIDDSSAAAPIRHTQRPPRLERRGGRKRRTS